MVLRWKASPGVSGYQVQISRETTFSQIVLDEKVKDPVLKWESLPATTFFWRVRSFDGEGRASEWSAPRQIAPATGAPAPRLPAEGTAITCSTEPVQLALEPSLVLKEYILELSADGRFGPTDTTVLLSKSGEFQAALPVGPMSFRGRGVDLTGRTTEPSAPRKLTVRLAAPRPKNTADVPAGTLSVTLSWAPSPCARRYVVEASHETPERSSLEAVDPSTSFKPAGVGEYRFRVAARDDKGNQSDWSADSTFRVRLPAPTARGEVVGPAGAAGAEVELSWTAPPQASSYLVEVSKLESFKDARPSSVSSLSTKVKLPAGRYLWRVSARDAAGHVSFSSEPRPFVVEEAAAPATVTVLFPGDGAILVRPADGMIGVTWSKVPGAVSHELELDGVVQPVALPPTRVALGDGDHLLRVRAVGATGKSSEWSSEVRFYFGNPRVVSAKVQFGTQPLRSDGVSVSRVVVRLLDPRGNVVKGAKPTLSVDRGALGPLAAEGDSWAVDWVAPAGLPPDNVATLSISEGTFKTQQQLALAGDFAPFTLGATLGGRFNFGAVRSPAGALSLAYRPPQLGGRLTAHVRAGLYGAAATIDSPDGPLAARVFASSLCLLAGVHFDFGRWSALAVVGGGAQLTMASVGAASQTSALPAFELVGAVGRRLGPGAVEVELSFLYSRLNTPLANLQAGGLFAGIGYRFDL